VSRQWSASRDAYEPVRHQDSAVIAVVDLVDGEGAERAESLDLAARVDHALAIVPRHGQRPHRVEQYVDLEAAAAALSQRIGDLLRGLPLLPHVLRVVDRLSSGFDDSELGRKDLVTIEQHLDPVA